MPIAYAFLKRLHFDQKVLMGSKWSLIRNIKNKSKSQLGKESALFNIKMEHTPQPPGIQDFLVL